MKKKLRNITVNEQSFVYWFSSGKKFVLNISPKEDKNIKIQLIFEGNAPDDAPLTYWAFYEIKGLRNDRKTLICLTKPKSISEIISYLKVNKNELFTKRQSHVVVNAMDLLNEMGYMNLEPVWVGEW